MTPTRTLPPRSKPPLGPWPGEYVETGGFRLFVRTVPDATGPEPAVFVHGLGGASTNWTDLQYLLADRVDGAAVDLPGFGMSDPPPDGDYSLDTHVRAVVRLVEQRFGTPVHLFGNSLGGAVATRLAAERPDLVRSLVLVSPALPDLRPRRIADPRIALMLVPGVTRLVVRRMAAEPPSERARRVLEMCYADTARVHPQRLDEAVAEVARRATLAWSGEALVASLRGLVKSYTERGAGSLWRQAAAVRAPTLVVCGRHDRLVDVSVGERARRVIRGARLVILDEGAHVSQLEHPELMAGEVQRLLETPSAAA